MTLRPLRANDAEAVAVIFFEAVHRGAAGEYSAAERAAWGGDAPDASRWRERLATIEGVVAELNRQPVGFMTIDASGYIDLAFVHPDYARRGVGGVLYAAVEARARRDGTTRLAVQASRTAKRFFERKGWMVEAEQCVSVRGVSMTNYRMAKPLLPQE